MSDVEYRNEMIQKAISSFILEFLYYKIPFLYSI
jgi:hypothetical protein